MKQNQSQPSRLLSRHELREKYGGIPRTRPAPEIIPDDVPEVLRLLIPLAEKWGIVEDDWVPQDVVRKVPREELEHIVESIYPHEVESEHLDEWLAGPEAEGPEYTEAYLAFTELRQSLIVHGGS